MEMYVFATGAGAPLALPMGELAAKPTERASPHRLNANLSAFSCRGRCPHRPIIRLRYIVHLFWRVLTVRFWDDAGIVPYKFNEPTVQFSIVLRWGYTPTLQDNRRMHRITFKNCSFCIKKAPQIGELLKFLYRKSGFAPLAARAALNAALFSYMRLSAMRSRLAMFAFSTCAEWA